LLPRRPLEICQAVAPLTSTRRSGKKFLNEGLLTAASVSRQCDDEADFKTFRVGLFGLEK
jgi:hypothetical protein